MEEPKSKSLFHRGWLCYGLVFLWVAVTGVAVILLVYSVTLGSAEEDPAPRREVIITNGTSPPCADDGYLMDHLCHTCEDCVDGQVCSRHGATSGCHDCPAGMHDDDFNVMTKCVDCPDGLTSSHQATGCVEPDDFVDNVAEKTDTIAGILGGLSTICAMVFACLRMSRGGGGDDDELTRICYAPLERGGDV